jgi:hypothetical protein
MSSRRTSSNNTPDTCSSLHDAAGSPIERSKAFDRFHRDLNFGQTKDRDLKEYRKALIDALDAGDLLDRATLYRHDLFAGKSQFKNPHTFALVTATPVMKDIALLAQAQTAAFFASDGRDMIDPDGATGTLFEVPFAIPLSELERDLKFVP